MRDRDREPMSTKLRSNSGSLSSACGNSTTAGLMNRIEEGFRDGEAKSFEKWEQLSGVAAGRMRVRG